jgi:hypothetical protein
LHKNLIFNINSQILRLGFLQSEYFCCVILLPQVLCHFSLFDFQLFKNNVSQLILTVLILVEILNWVLLRFQCDGLQQQAALMAAATAQGTFINPMAALASQMPHGALNGMANSVVPPTSGESLIMLGLTIQFLVMRYARLQRDAAFAVLCPSLRVLPALWLGVPIQFNSCI